MRILVCRSAKSGAHDRTKVPQASSSFQHIHNRIARLDDLSERRASFWLTWRGILSCQAKTEVIEVRKVFVVVALRFPMSEQDCIADGRVIRVLTLLEAVTECFCESTHWLL